MANDLQRDLKVLTLFIGLYCRHRHGQAAKQPASMKLCDISAVAGRDVLVCADCAKLLKHAIVKRTYCPIHPKPQCKHCPSHCYAPEYRAKIQEVMRFSGRKMVMSGRLDYLLHLLF
jgi:Nitrous oxide-stimulated promoter